MIIACDEAINQLLKHVPSDAPLYFCAARGVDGRWSFNVAATIKDDSFVRMADTASAAVGLLVDKLESEAQRKYEAQLKQVEI